MSDLEDVRRKLATFDAEADPEAFWDLLTEEAVARVDAAFALVLLLDEDEEFVVYPGEGLESEDLNDFEESPTFGAAIEAVGSDKAAVGGDTEDPAGPEPVYSLAVPLRIDGEVAGALAVERYEHGPFGPEPIAKLEALIDVFGPSLASFFE